MRSILLVAALTAVVALRVPKDEEESGTVTVKRLGSKTKFALSAKLQCDNCNGDPSDMAMPFYRYNGHQHEEVVNEFTVPEKTHFWNAADTASCLKDKYVLMLGDSTLLENTHDLIMLLGGGPKKMPMDKFYKELTKIPKEATLDHPAKHDYPTDRGVLKTEWYARNRNATISLMEDNTLIKFRFIGSENLYGNCDGVSTLLKETVKKEINNMVENGGRKPDVIVIHSAAHDMCNSAKHKTSLKKTYKLMERVGSEVIKPWVEDGIQVIWRGSYRFPKERQDLEYAESEQDFRFPKELDDTAKDAVEKNGGTFVDVADILANYHDSSGCCTTIKSATSTMPHVGSVSKYHDYRASTFLSQLSTYPILDGICPYAASGFFASVF